MQACSRLGVHASAPLHAANADRAHSFDLMFGDTFAAMPCVRGWGEGFGKNLNLPLPSGTSDAPYLAALDHALETVRAFEPEACVVALGLDAFEDDSSEMMRVTTAGFGAIGARIGALRLPSVIVQEGGCAVEALRRNLGSFLGGFLSVRGV